MIEIKYAERYNYAKPSTSSQTMNNLNGYFDCIKSWLTCMFTLTISFIREPLTLYNTTKRLRRI